MLDEATSALDRETEKKVQANVDSDMKGKTCLVVAHRIETIMNSDRIYMFDQGEILEEGSYQELMAKKKHFFNLERGEKLRKEWFDIRYLEGSLSFGGFACHHEDVGEHVHAIVCLGAGRQL